MNDGIFTAVYVKDGKVYQVAMEKGDFNALNIFVKSMFKGKEIDVVELKLKENDKNE